jgi:hypothetical protein
MVENVRVGSHNFWKEPFVDETCWEVGVQKVALLVRVVEIQFGGFGNLVVYIKGELISV